MAPLALLASTSAGCFPAATIPMRVDARPGPRPESGAPSPVLVLLLPGRGDRGEVFEETGFVSAARAAGWTADLALVDAHFGYYVSRTLIPRLDADVVAPARAQQRRLWALGVSAGGFGALRQEQEHPGSFEGIALFAPFLGEGAVIGEIERAGGLANWQPGEVKPGDHERELWTYLKARTAAPDTPGPRLILAFGRSDMYARQARILAAALPAEQVVTGPGGHHWSTWRALFDEVLRRDLIPGR